MLTGWRGVGGGADLARAARQCKVGLEGHTDNWADEQQSVRIPKLSIAFRLL